MKFISILGLFCLCGLLAAQIPEPTLDERIQVQLIELDVKVTDWSGNFIYRLEPKDLLIKENGKPIEIDKMEEISLRRLNPADEQDYKSRVMLLIDFQNTEYRVLKPGFKRLRHFFEFQYDQQSEIGIAVNNGGIQEIIGFTSDSNSLLKALDEAENLYSKSSFREFYKVRSGRSGLARYDRSPFRGFSRAINDGLSSYLSNEIEKLGQFVHYLGAFSGKKNLVLLTGVWGPGIADSNNEGSQDRSDVLSLKDIQTACLYHKLSINVIGLVSSGDPTYYNTGRSSLGLHHSDWTGSLASATSGFVWNGTSGNLSNALYRAIEKGEQYYRVRYYSSIANDNYRDLSVTAKGFKRLAYSFAGYYPEKQPVSAETSSLTHQRNSKGYRVTADSRWLQWASAGWGKQEANYAVAVSAYDDNGRILAEKVTAGSLLRKKKADYPLIETLIELNLPSQPAKIETRIIDLNTGNQTGFEHSQQPGV